MTQGRAWERYAWLKARPITGARHDELDALVTPFVFRKYLDYDAYEGLRDVHRQIREQGARRDALSNVKLGEGGIREIEFIVQALQIVRGGREPDLRVRGTLPALATLDARGLAAVVVRRRRCATRTCSCATSSTGCSTATTSRRTDLPDDAAERACARRGDGPRRRRASTARSRDHRNVVSFTFAQTFGDAGPRGRRRRDDALRRGLGATRGRRRTTARSLRDAGFDDPDARARHRSRACATPARYRSCRPRRASASTRWCRSSSRRRLRTRDCPARRPCSSGCSRCSRPSRGAARTSRS